jgi:hypothetical protein
MFEIFHRLFDGYIKINFGDCLAVLEWLRTVLQY